MKQLNLPIEDDVIRDLKVGDPVAITGVILTGRDSVHKWMIDTFIKKTRQPQGDDQEVYDAIKRENQKSSRLGPSETKDIGN